MLGLRDVPAATPIYVGPGEAGQKAFMNVMVRGVTDRTLAGKGPLQELRFEQDADGRFAGVLDLFMDRC